MSGTVVIFSSRTPFVEGIIRRLLQTVHRKNVRVVDPGTSSAMSELVACNPSIVLYDATDSNAAFFCNQHNLLYKFPSLRIIRVDPEGEHMLIFSSECYQAHRVQDLLDVIFRLRHATPKESA